MSLRPHRSWIISFLLGGVLGLGSLRADDLSKPSSDVKESSFKGHVLVTPLMANETVLLNSDQTEAHTWASLYKAGAGARLLPDGSILRIAAATPARPYRNTPFAGGRLQRIAWDGSIIWDFWNAADAHMVCGDAILLPNGNVLMSVVEYRSKADCLALGRDEKSVFETGLFAPGLMEFHPTGRDTCKLVWRWSLWDHVSQSSDATKPNYDEKGANTHRVDVNRGLPGFGMKISALSYDAASDLIVASVPRAGEFWVLDHSTTTDEAKTERGGKWSLGGNLSMRWRPAEPNPESESWHLASAELESAGNTQSFPKVLALSSYRLADGVLQCAITHVGLKEKIVGKTRQLEPAPTVGPAWTVDLTTVIDGPTSLAEAGNGMTMMTAGAKGAAELLNKNTSIVWTHLNQRGKRHMLIHRLKAGEKCCLPLDQLKKQTDPSDTKVEVGTIGTARYYDAGFLKPLSGQPAVSLVK